MNKISLHCSYSFFSSPFSKALTSFLTPSTTRDIAISLDFPKSKPVSLCFVLAAQNLLGQGNTMVGLPSSLGMAEFSMNEIQINICGRLCYCSQLFTSPLYKRVRHPPVAVWLAKTPCEKSIFPAPLTSGLAWDLFGQWNLSRHDMTTPLNTVFPLALLTFFFFCLCHDINMFQIDPAPSALIHVEQTHSQLAAW